MTAQIINFPSRNTDPHKAVQTRPVEKPQIDEKDTTRLVMKIHQNIRKMLKWHGIEDKQRYNESYQIITDEILYQISGEKNEDR